MQFSCFMFFKCLEIFFFLSRSLFVVWRSKSTKLDADANRAMDRRKPQRAVTVPMRNNEEGIQGL